MANHAIVRTDKMAGTDVRSELVSVRYQPSETMTAIDNGNVVKLGALEDGSREIYKGLTPAKDDNIKDIVLVASPEIVYDARLAWGLGNFFNDANDIARGYRLHKDDIFSVTAEALAAEADIEVGNVVELDDGTKLKVVAEATSGSTAIGKVIDINIVSGVKFYAIEIG